MEVSFPEVVFNKKVLVSENDSWKYSAGWKTEMGNILGESKGDVAEFTFNGTGVSLSGEWNKTGGRADIYIDDKFDRTIDTYFNYNGQEYGNTSIWHKFGLPQGEHKVRIEAKGEKCTGSEGTKVNLTDALVFVTAPKKNENFKILL